MFVCSLRASTLKFFSVVAISLVALLVLVALVPSYEEDVTATYVYEKIRGEDDAEEFLGQFGWVVDAEPLEVTEVVMPDEFDKVFSAYNEIQKEQGLNLLKYKGKKLTRYTFLVKNYKDYDGKVLANVLVYRGKVVGGDICSADVNGFVHGFEEN